jgi:hypothetical protein
MASRRTYYGSYSIEVWEPCVRSDTGCLVHLDQCRGALRIHRINGGSRGSAEVFAKDLREMNPRLRVQVTR